MIELEVENAVLVRVAVALEDMATTQRLMLKEMRFRGGSGGQQRSMMTIHQVAKRLGLSPRTVERRVGKPGFRGPKTREGRSPSCPSRIGT